MSEPAFPAHENWTDAGGTLHSEFRGVGLTKREWFAGMALAGLMSNASMPFAPDYAECEPEEIAKASFLIADTMIAASKDHAP